MRTFRVFDVHVSLTLTNIMNHIANEKPRRDNDPRVFRFLVRNCRRRIDKFVFGTFRERDALNAMLIMMKCHEIKRVVKNYTAIECTGCYGQYSFGR